MKRLFTLIALLTAFASAEARVRTVSNNPAIPGQYTTVDAAVAAAQAGDTLAISGSPNQYNVSNNLIKRLVFIGPGLNPALTPTARLNYLTIDSSNLGNAKGSILAGIEFGGMNITSDVSNIEVKDCQLNGYLYVGAGCRNTVLRNNVLNGISVSNTSRNTLISNNIVTSSVSASSSTCIITNNLFIGNTGDVFSSASNMVVTNNLFVGRTPRGATNTVFSNNLTYATNNNDLPYGTNTGGGNLVSVDPQLTSSNGVQYNIDHDYRLQAGSPARNAGTDGSDIGPTGGGFPWWQQLSNNGLLPWISELNILNASVTPTGNLQVRIKGRKGR